MSGGRFDALFRGGGRGGGKEVGGKGVGGGAASLTFQAVSKEEKGRYSMHEGAGFFLFSQTVLEYGGQIVTVVRLPVFRWQSFNFPDRVRPLFWQMTKA